MMKGATDNSQGVGQHEKLHRVISTPMMALLGLNAALGSAILFSVAGITASAGPAGIISFLIGAVLFTVIALTQLELSKTFPEAGAPARYPLYTHGEFAGLINSFANMIWYIFIPPFEGFAVIEGINFFWPVMINSSGFPTLVGVVVAVIATLLFIPLNYFGSRLVGVSNALAGIVKVCLYALLGIGLLAVYHTSGNLVNYGGFVPFGFAGILAALPLVMFAYASARIIADYAEEAKSIRVLKPAIAYLVLGQMLVYVLFDYVFLTGINWSALGVTPGDWAKLSVVTTNPFILLSSNAHLPVLVGIAFVIGIIGPFLTGYVYLGAGARVLLSAGRSGYVNQRFTYLHAKYKVPNWAVVTFGVIGAILAFMTSPIPSIFSIIDYALVGGYLGYSFSAVSMAAARRQGLTKERFSDAGIIPAASFAIGSLIVFWSGWPSVPYALAILTAGVLVFGILFRVHRNIANGLWSVFYILFLLIMTYIGSVGALDIVPFFAASFIVMVVSLVVFYPWGVLSSLHAVDAIKHYDEAHLSTGESVSK